MQEFSRKGLNKFVNKKYNKIKDKYKYKKEHALQLLVVFKYKIVCITYIYWREILTW